MKVFLKLILMVLVVAVKSSCVKIADKDVADSKPFVDEQSLEKQVHSDLLIEGRMVLKEDTLLQVGRLHFAEGAVIQTNEFDLEIQAEILFAERGAEIINFPLDKPARKFKDGRAGGEVIVTAREAFGDLNITLSGEAGSEGEPGNPDRSKLDGKKGAPGKWGYSSTTMKHGGFVPKFVCGRAPQNGKAGSPALDGEPGKSGYKGGDSGALVIDIESGEELRLLVDRFPGPAGAGGLGGPGGKGGMGGDPGTLYTSKKKKSVHSKDHVLGTGCTLARRGPAGADGTPGTDGAIGLEGAPGKICLRFRSSDQFECQ